MKSSLTIKRNTGESHPWGFAQLRKEGIEISQALSGSGWTDYNYHDPGVTILEQLCFALTDLIYRSKFDVGDYLCDMRGDIDMQALGLHAPQDVLFGRPATVLDYQKALADMSHDINDVRIATDGSMPGAGGYGLYRVRVRSAAQSGDDAPDASELVRQTTQNYHKIRNLCEDLESEVLVAEDIDCQLMAEISIKPGYRVAHVIAELFHLTVRELDRGVSYISYSDGLEEGRSLDSLFEGPFTQNGLISNDAFTVSGEDQDLRLLESAILSRARKIEGIDYIAALRLRPLASPEDESDERRYRLAIPEQAKDFRDIRPFSANRPVNFSIAEFKAQYEMLRFAGRTKAYRLSEDRLLSEPPRGIYRDLGRYQSVQNQFPAAYGINQFGVPESDPPERQAQALQLKAYLLLFEQIMSNYLANLGSIRQLFSVRFKEESTYFKGILDSNEIRDLDAVYPENAAEILDEILGKLDDFVGRKGRLLDYLLALYGEEFNQEHLQGSNYYLSDEELKRSIILNKIRLLNRIKFASGDRAAAMNVFAETDSKLSGGNDRYGDLENGRVSGLQYRSSIFLGFKDLVPKSLVAEVFRHNLEVLGDERSAAGDRRDALVTRARELFAGDFGAEDERYYQFVRRNIAEFAPLNNGRLERSLLVYGVNESNYEHREGKLYLKLGGAGSVEERAGSDIALIDVGDEEAAGKSRFLRRLLIHLSKESEGMHVLEHILLRPQNFTDQSPEVKEQYANKISVFLPSWTARTQDREFRSLAEDILRENCPAHIQLNVYWLGFADMCEFEVLQHAWQESLRRNDRFENPGVLDQKSQSLLRFVELQRAGKFSAPGGGDALRELRSSIAEKTAIQLEHYRNRRRDLQLSARREQDPELNYLSGIESFQEEMQKFQFLIINHMQLLESDDGGAVKLPDSEDWSFYLGRSSVILPKPKAFRLGSSHKKHFHGIKTLVEDEISAALGSATTTTFHWVVPKDFKRVVLAYRDRQREGGQHRLRVLLKRLQDNTDVSGSAQSWRELLDVAQ